MLVRHAAIAAVMFSAILAGCNKRNEAPATPAASDTPAAAPVTPPTPPTMAPPPAPADNAGSTEKKP